MSVSRILLAPTHRTGLAHALTAAVAEVVGRQERQVRFHHLGPISPPRAWDRWEGSAFLDPALYDRATMVRLYDESTAGAALSLLSTSRGLLDTAEGASWTPADVARALDCPAVLVMDCRGWGEGLAGVVAGFNERLGDLNLAGLLLTGVEDRAHRDLLKRALSGVRPGVVGWVYQGAGPGWDTPAPGLGQLPVSDEVVAEVFRQVDVAGLETLAGQRGFLPVPKVAAPAAAAATPLIMVAGGQGFTPWSRDSIDVLQAAGLRVQRLDLLNDQELPPETAGLILAGYLWVDSLPDLAANLGLMADVHARIAEGLPTLALGGGMLYLLRQLADDRGRSFRLAGVLPSDGELLGSLEEPLYLDVTAERETVLLAQGQNATGWVLQDAEIAETAVSRWFPLRVNSPITGQEWLEGAATPRLLCSRILLHPASVPGSAERFAGWCARYAEEASRPSR